MYIIKERIAEKFFVPLILNNEFHIREYPTFEEADIARISLQPEIDNLLIVEKIKIKEDDYFSEEAKAQRLKKSIQDEILAILDEEIETEINCNKMGVVVELAREVLCSVKSGIVNINSVTY